MGKVFFVVVEFCNFLFVFVLELKKLIVGIVGFNVDFIMEIKFVEEGKLFFC